MGLKSKFFGLGAALTLGLTLVGPATATGLLTQDVKILVVDNGQPVPTVGATGAAGGTDFGTLNLDAAGDTNTGVKVAGDPLTPVLVTIDVSNDTSLFRATTTVITMSLVGGAIPFADAAPSFYGSGATDLQIPGKYLKIAAVTNPAQQKWTGASSPSCTVWTNNGSEGCAPKSVTTAGHTIYHVGDAHGMFGGCILPGSASTSVPSAPTGCADTSFGPGGNTTVMTLVQGSGTVHSGMVVQLGLSVPAGVYPGHYQGTLNVDATTTP
jgi:hypothetical protein